MENGENGENGDGKWGQPPFFSFLCGLILPSYSLFFGRPEDLNVDSK